VASAKELWRGKPVAGGKPLDLEIPAGDMLILDLRLR